MGGSGTVGIQQKAGLRRWQFRELLASGRSRSRRSRPRGWRFGSSGEWWISSIESSQGCLSLILESFGEKFRSRWYDFPFHGVKGVVAGVIVGEIELCRRVFMVLYRM
ncbi:hypothetical protein DY000_02047162 [Brassica cretica]|uniref:Uncharacterized protein n=1 Tax=Brassica cretica TaxID=69181 RepID=A0ABQ7F4W2_BRACR|nr:hypothetical protein DY000_02047162 [Brassica cretica]